MDQIMGIARRFEEGALRRAKGTIGTVLLAALVFAGLSGFALAIDFCLGTLPDLVG